MKLRAIFCLSLLFFVVSCDTAVNPSRTIYMYKTKADYSSYVPIELSIDKTKITSAPGRLGSDTPLRLIRGYYLFGTMGINTAYLSLTIEEWNSYDPILGVDSMYQYIMETDPFLEYYESDDMSFRITNGEFGIDTAFINNLIREDRITEYFTRII